MPRFASDAPTQAFSEMTVTIEARNDTCQHRATEQTDQECTHDPHTDDTQCPVRPWIHDDNQDGRDHHDQDAARTAQNVGTDLKTHLTCGRESHDRKQHDTKNPIAMLLMHALGTAHCRWHKSDTRFPGSIRTRIVRQTFVRQAPSTRIQGLNAVLPILFV
jgi:hypothetical protein